MYKWPTTLLSGAPRMMYDMEPKRNRRPLKQPGSAFSVHAYALAVNPIVPDPAVYPATIIAYLEALSLLGFDEVQVLIAIHLTENDVANFQFCGFHGCDGA